MRTARIVSCHLVTALCMTLALMSWPFVQVVQAQQAAPPEANALPPINVGSGSQTKEGGLGLGSLIVKGGSVFEGNVGINMASDIELGVRGKIGADALCNRYGEDCIDMADLLSQVIYNNTSGGSLWSQGSDDEIYYQAGNVGIGTANPVSTLDVDGRVTATDVRLLGFLLFDNNTGGDYIAHGSQEGLTYYENGNQAWRLSGTEDNYILGGNLGLGTDSPQVGIHLESETAGIRMRNTNDTAYWQIDPQTTGSLTLSRGGTTNAQFVSNGNFRVLGELRTDSGRVNMGQGDYIQWTSTSGLSGYENGVRTWRLGDPTTDFLFEGNLQMQNNTISDVHSIVFNQHDADTAPGQSGAIMYDNSGNLMIYRQGEWQVIGGTVEPPVCTGANKGLQWNGSEWSCETFTAVYQ